VNSFESLTKKLRERLSSIEGLRCELGKPVQKDGLWTFTIIGGDGYLLELGWQKHRGYALSAGYEHDFGAGFDEICTNGDEAFVRSVSLVERRGATLSNAPMTVAELRKLLGVLQHDLAAQLGMTKGGLAQLEKAGSLGRMQVGTIEKLIAGLGGKLVLSAQLPNGEVRELVG
jgi:hypothetical protein